MTDIKFPTTGDIPGKFEADIPQLEEAAETPEELVEEIRTEVKETFEEEEKPKEEDEEEAPESDERIKASDEKAVPATPTEPVTEPAAKPAKKSDKAGKVVTKIKGLEGIQVAEKSNVTKLVEEIKKDELLRIVFLSSDPIKELEKKGYKVPTLTKLRELVDEFLKTVGDRTAAMSKRYKPKQSLTVAALDIHGIEPDWLPEFADDLKERLTKQIKASEESEKPATAPPTAPPAVPAPAPTPEPAVPTPTPEPAVTPAAKPAAPAQVKPGKKEEAKEKKTEVTEEHKKIMAIIKKAGKVSESEIGKRLSLGMKRTYILLAELEDMGVIKKGVVDQKVLNKLLPEKVKETSEQVAERLFEALKNDPKFKELIPLLKKYKDNKNKQMRLKIQREGYDQLKAFLRQNIFAEGAGKGVVDTKMVFENLVKVMKGKITTNRARKAIELIVSDMKGASGEEKIPDTQPSPSVKPVAEKEVTSEEIADTVDAPGSVDSPLPAFTAELDYGPSPTAESANEPVAEPEAAPDAGSEKEAIASLKQYMTRLTEGQAALEDLRKRFESIFEILKANPTELSVADREYFETIQGTMRNILLSEVPDTIEGMSACKSVSEFLTNLKSLDLRKQKKALKAINTTLMEDEELTEVIEDYYRIFGKAASTPSTEPEATPAPDEAKEASAEAKTDEATAAPAEPETAPERTPIPNDVAALFEAEANGDKKKKERLLDLWELYNDKAKLEDETAHYHAKTYMQLAISYLDSPRSHRAKKMLENALEIEGDIILNGASTPPSSTPSTPPSSPPPAPSASGGATASAGPAVTPGSRPTARAQQPIMSNNQGHDPNVYQTKEAQTSAINKFLVRMGYPASNTTPEVMAIRSVLNTMITGPTILDELEDFLNKGEIENEIDKLAKLDPKELNKRRAEIHGQMAAKSAEIARLNRKLKHLSNPDEATVKENAKKIGKLEAEKEKLSDKQQNIKRALKKQENKTEEDENERYSRTPERLLAMINFHFAKRNMKKGKKIEYDQILLQTQEQIEKVRQKDVGALNWVANRLLPWNYLKPMLTGTLQAICEKDKDLKKITPEEAKALAKAYKYPDRISAWINDLEGSPQQKMELIVPKLIAYLAITANTGRVANINSLSMNRAKILLRYLRHEVHEYSIKHAEKSSKKGTLNRMGAYFEQYNKINENAKAQEHIVVNNSRKKMWRNIGIIGGTGLGANAIAGLALSGIVGASTASLAGITMGSSFRTEKPETKALLQRTSVRALAAGGIGAMALAVASPFAAVPLGMAALGGVFAPEIFKKRKEIYRAAKRGTIKATPYAAKGAWWTGRLGGMLLFSLGIGMFSKRYRQFWGFSK